MRLIVTVLALAIAGCAEHRPAPTAAAHPEASETTAAQTGRVCALRSGGREVLRLSVPADATCTPAEGSLGLRSREGFVTFWLVPAASTTEQALAQVPTVIADEFKGFVTTGKSPMTLPSGPATRLMGTGTEADDGDPGTADVIVFAAGGRVFVACTHGESLTNAAKQWMEALVRSAQAP